jgi:D-alanyl-D-alanine dipeptidase
VLDHVGPYEVGDARAYPAVVKRLGSEAAKHRVILSEALSGTELTNYPSEYWHWSFGDQGWAYRGGHPAALYGPIEPPGYLPPEGDDVEEPLIWLG